MTTVAPTLLLAPMQAVTDRAFRTLITSLGGVHGCFSAYARVSCCALGSKALTNVCPEILTGGKTPCGVSVTIQLLGANPHLMALTASCAVQRGASRIDINFGCPVQRVNRHDGGAALLQSPHRMTQIVRAVRNAVGSRVVVSCKLRLGWADVSEAEIIAQAVQQGGVDYMVFHGRTRQQGYGGHADWIAINRARKAVSVPIVANGDIGTPQDLQLCAQQSGCSSFMIGRGVLRRPELFRVLSGLDKTWWDWQQRLALLVRFGDMLIAENDGMMTLGMVTKPTMQASVLARVKGWCRYMAEVNGRIASEFEQLKTIVSWPLLREYLLRTCQKK